MNALYSIPSIYSTSKSSGDDNKSVGTYDALPNLKRLSEKLKTEKSEGPIQCGRLDCHVIVVVVLIIR